MLTPFVALAQSMALAYASGISVYATILLVGLMQRAHWIAPLPGPMGVASNPIVLILCGALSILELGAQLIPGIATVWEAVHTAIRPPAAALIAVATAWHANPVIIASAALLGGGIGLVTHTTKLGVRAAVDTSPEPFSNGILSAGELGVVAAISYFAWSHPVVTLLVALLLLLLAMLILRTVWRHIRGMSTEVVTYLRGREGPAQGRG